MTHQERSGLARLMLRWPERREKLSRACALFDLFAGYSLACQSADLWSRQAGERAELIAKDYREVISALELQISESLGD